MPATTPCIPKCPLKSARTGRLIERVLRDGAHTLADAELLQLLWGDRPDTSAGQAAGLLGPQLLDAHNGSLRALAAERPANYACPSFPRLARPRHPGARESVPGEGIFRHHRAVLQAALEFSRRSLRESLAQRPIIGSPAELRDFLTLWLRERPRECFSALFLDSQNRLICAEELFQGSVAQTMVYPREIARRAIETRASALIVAHNHPSGMSAPSAADRKLTSALRRALELIDIPLLDHVIVADNSCFSFAEAGLL
jgi:DNA repair protein RadC